VCGSGSEERLRGVSRVQAADAASQRLSCAACLPAAVCRVPRPPTTSVCTERCSCPPCGWVLPVRPVGLRAWARSRSRPAGSSGQPPGGGTGHRGRADARQPPLDARWPPFWTGKRGGWGTPQTAAHPPACPAASSCCRRCGNRAVHGQAYQGGHHVGHCVCDRHRLDPRPPGLLPGRRIRPPRCAQAPASPGELRQLRRRCASPRPRLHRCFAPRPPARPPAPAWRATCTARPAVRAPPAAHGV
jgi:hypothetical protein